MRGGKFKSFNRHILNFRVIVVRGKAMNVLVKKYILISRFLAFLEDNVVGKVLV